MDARDGNSNQTTWLDRSGNSNNATLHNSNFDSNGGWTGTGLKLDGVKDYVELNLSEAFKYVEVGFKVLSVNGGGWKRHVSFSGANTIMSPEIGLGNFVESILDGTGSERETLTLGKLINKSSSVWKNKNFKSAAIGKALDSNGDYSNVEICYIKFYNDILTPEEVKQNLEYEKTINRETVAKLSVLDKEKDYGIGHAYQSNDEQLKTFRLSNDKTKFVSGLKYCGGLQVQEYTYSEILDIMNTSEWITKKIWYNIKRRWESA